MRIVSLLPSATEMLFAIGAGDMVVAITHECDHPPEAQALPRVTSNALDHDGAAPATIDRHIKSALHEGSGLYHLDERLLADLRPDLIVTQELCEVCAVSYHQVQKAVRRLDTETPVISLEPSSLDDIVSTALLLGDATGCSAGALRLAGAMRRRIHAVSTSAARSEDERPRVACIEWTDPLMAGGHWVPEMVDRAGGRDVLGTPGAKSRYIEWDAVCDADPEVMVMMPCGYNLDATCELAEGITGRAGFRELSCARSGRVVAVDGSAYFNRPGPRIVDGLEILEQIVAPDPGDLRDGARWLT